MLSACIRRLLQRLSRTGLFLMVGLVAALAVVALQFPPAALAQAPDGAVTVVKGVSDQLSSVSYWPGYFQSLDQGCEHSLYFSCCLR